MPITNKKISGCYKCFSKLVALSRDKGKKKYPIICSKCKTINRKIINHCYLCKSTKNESWGKPIRNFYAVRCSKCDLVYLKNPLTDTVQNLFYKNYMKNVHQRRKIKVFQRSKMYQIEFNYLTSSIGIKNFKKIKNVLDVGCGGGFFLDLFKRNKIKTYGTEVGEDSFLEAKKKHQMYYGEFNKKMKITKKFDLIIMRGVVEHVTNPRAYITLAKKLIKKNGFFFITATPNLESIMAKIFKERWTLHTPETHIMHLKESHLDSMIENKNFKKIASSPMYLQTPYENFREDIKKIYKEISLQDKGLKSTLESPPFFGSIVTALYKKF